MNTATISDAITTRLRKLLELSKSANLSEAKLAATRAAELMAKHQISACAVPATPDDAVSEATIHTFDKTANWRNVLANGVAKAHGCRMLAKVEPDHVTARKLMARDRKLRDAGGMPKPWRSPILVSIVFIGPKADIEVLGYLYMFLVAEIERLCQEAYEALPPEERPKSGAAVKWYNGWKHGAVAGIVKSMAEERQRVVGGSSVALVLRDKEQEAQAHLDRLQPKIKGIAGLGDMGAYAKGVKVGRGISLNKNATRLSPGHKQLAS